MRSLLVAIFGWVAEQERLRLIERTRAGLARARAQGKRIGRPRASSIALTAAAELVSRDGVSIRKAASRWGIGATTLRDHLRACAETVPSPGSAGPA